LHLDVLQTLLLESSVPEALLRINSKAIEALLEPSAGLGPVLRSSRFDAAAVRQKLEPIEASSDPSKRKIALCHLLTIALQV